MGVLVETVEMLAAKFEAVLPHLDERQRRLLLGAEARALGMAGSGRWPRPPGCVRRRYRWGSMSWSPAPGHWAGYAAQVAAANG